MSAREVMAKVFSGAPYPSKRTYDRVTDVLDALTDAGYVILSPDEVRGIRDEALEEAAELIERQESSGGYSTAIRSLKGGRDAQ